MNINLIENRVSALANYAVGTTANKQRAALLSMLAVGPTYSELKKFTGYDAQTLMGVIDEAVNGRGLHNGGDLDPEWVARRLPACKSLIGEVQQFAREWRKAVVASPPAPKSEPPPAAETAKEQVMNTTFPVVKCPRHPDCVKPARHRGGCWGGPRNPANRAALVAPPTNGHHAAPTVAVEAAPNGVTAARVLKIHLKKREFEYAADGLLVRFNFLTTPQPLCAELIGLVEKLGLDGVEVVKT